VATSGTVGTTIFTTQQVIDHAYRRMKMAAELVSGEKIETALENLWLILQTLSSKGIPIWRIETQILPFYQGQIGVNPLIGTVEVLNANTRILQRLTGTYATDQGGDPDLAFDGDLETACTQTAPDGSITVDFGDATTIMCFGLMPNASGLWDFVYEVSEDGVTWETVSTYTDQAMVARRWQWVDVQITRWPSYQYARLRATGGTTLDVTEWFIGNNPQAIPMAPINKDDYFNLPNKSFQGRPVQFWQEMARDNPVLKVWPVPNAAATFYQCEAQCHRMIEDVGEMSMQLDLPARWYDWVVDELAVKQGREDPDFKGDVRELQAFAAESLKTAQGGITNKGPIYIQPNISPYTRG
jgi:hypothetical protein